MNIPRLFAQSSAATDDSAITDKSGKVDVDFATITERVDNMIDDMPFPTQIVLLHDQTEETDADRTRQRERLACRQKPARTRTGGTPSR